MDTNSTQKEPLLHTFQTKEPMATGETGFTTKATTLILVVAVLFGGLSGFIFKKVMGGGNSTAENTGKVSNDPATEIVGVQGKKNFKDKAEGVLKKGGTGEEGSHHLERQGGESQNVYLTSSTVDLSRFENKKVRVHGETFTAEKAGWLMDVGLVEVLE